MGTAETRAAPPTHTRSTAVWKYLIFERLITPKSDQLKECKEDVVRVQNQLKTRVDASKKNSVLNNGDELLSRITVICINANIVQCPMIY
jgi:hypothetical protein